jgi:hypothetical protein
MSLILRSLPARPWTRPPRSSPRRPPGGAWAAIQEKFAGAEREAALWGWQAGWSAHAEGAYAALAALGRDGG